MFSSNCGWNCYLLFLSLCTVSCLHDSKKRKKVFSDENFAPSIKALYLCVCLCEIVSLALSLPFSFGLFQLCLAICNYAWSSQAVCKIHMKIAVGFLPLCIMRGLWGSHLPQSQCSVIICCFFHLSLIVLCSDAVRLRDHFRMLGELWGNLELCRVGAKPLTHYSRSLH